MSKGRLNALPLAKYMPLTISERCAFIVYSSLLHAQFFYCFKDKTSLRVHCQKKYMCSGTTPSGAIVLWNMVGDSVEASSVKASKYKKLFLCVYNSLPMTLHAACPYMWVMAVRCWL